jgi:hypothetical protein
MESKGVNWTLFAGWISLKVNDSNGIREISKLYRIKHTSLNILLHVVARLELEPQDMGPQRRVFFWVQKYIS